MFTIVKKERLNPTVTKMVIDAPKILIFSVYKIQKICYINN